MFNTRIKENIHLNCDVVKRRLLVNENVQKRKIDKIQQTESSELLSTGEDSAHITVKQFKKDLKKLIDVQRTAECNCECRKQLEELTIRYDNATNKIDRLYRLCEMLLKVTQSLSQVRTRLPLSHEQTNKISKVWKVEVTTPNAKAKKNVDYAPLMSTPVRAMVAETNSEVDQISLKKPPTSPVLAVPFKSSATTSSSSNNSDRFPDVIPIEDVVIIENPTENAYVKSSNGSLAHARPEITISNPPSSSIPAHTSGAVSHYVTESSGQSPATATAIVLSNSVPIMVNGTGERVIESDSTTKAEVQLQPVSTVHADCVEQSERVPPRPRLTAVKCDSKVTLCWNMMLKPKTAAIKSFHLFARKHSDSIATSSWIKIGEIDPLPFPMACSLFGFDDPGRYSFVIVACDCYGRFGEFSHAATIGV